MTATEVTGRGRALPGRLAGSLRGQGCPVPPWRGPVPPFGTVK